MNIVNAYHDLKTFYNLNSKSYKLTNPFFCLNDKNSSLSWGSYISDEVFDDYDKYYAWVLENSQYSLAFADEALIRIYLHGDDSITNGSMSFLPDPSINSTYFRFDVDFSRAQEFIHSSYHIHMGYNNSRFRFSLLRYPHPSQFLYFIAFLLGYYECNSFDKTKFFDTLDSIPEKYNHFLNLNLNP